MIPTFSIVLATYNRANTLRNSIQSVLDQTFRDFELLIIDDGSTDESEELIATFMSDDRVHYTKIAHLGSAAARNHGVRLATGKYIAFQDSDDEWLPEKLTVAAETLDASEDKFALFYTDMWRCKSNQTRVLYPAPLIESRELISPITLDYAVYGIGLQSAVIKRECFDEIGLFDEQLRRFIDLDIFVRLQSFSTFIKGPQPLVNFHESSGISTNHQAQIDARLYLLKKHHDLFTNHPEWEAAQYLRLAQVASKIAGSAQALTYLETASRLAPEGSEPAQRAWLELAEVQKSSRKSWKTQCKLTRLQEAAQDNLHDSLSLLETFQKEQLKTLNSLPWILGNLLHGRLWVLSRKKRLKRLRELETQLDNQRYKIQQSDLISTSDAAAKRQNREKKIRPVTVIIPVFNNYEAVVTCVESVLIHTLHPHEILLIDDRSSDERIWPKLREYAKIHDHIRILRNKKNLGYTKTVNIGCEFVRPSDVILLNSDTIVTPFWLEKMTAAAYSRSDVATVTAMSSVGGNLSGLTSETRTELPDGLSAAEYGGWIEKLTQRRRPVTPCAQGCCFYVSRTALDQVGAFEEATFPRGNGAKNDFSMRAHKKTLWNLVDDATFIYQKPPLKLDSEKDKALQSSQLKLQELHSEYKTLHKQWLKNDSVNDLHRSLLNKPWKNGSHQTPSKTGLLYVHHANANGTRLTSEDLIGKMTGHYEVRVLETSDNHWTLYQASEHRLVALRRYHLTERWQYYLPLNRERLDVLNEILNFMEIETIHFRNFIGNGPDALLLAKKKGVSVVVSAHDYYAICPTANLLDEKMNYCGGHCSKEVGTCELRGRSFDQKGPLLKNAYVNVYRKTMAETLSSSCDALITPSHFSRAVIEGHFPDLTSRLHVIEPGSDLPRLDLAKQPIEGQPIRILCLGNMTVPRGIHFLQEIMQLDQTEGSRFEFHFLGTLPKEFANPNLFRGVNHGRYKHENLAEHIRQIAPAFTIAPSIWPEPYSHVLTESWAFGIPVFASNIGTLQSRIEKNGGGWLLDYHSARESYSRMLAVANDPAEYELKKEQIRQMISKPISEMTAEYLAVYFALQGAKIAPATKHLGLSLETHVS